MDCAMRVPIFLKLPEFPGRATGLHRSRRGSFTLRPVDTDGIAPVPVQSGLAHLIKDADADGRRLRHLNDRARVPFIEKIDEGAARSVTLLADLPTGCQRALAELTIVHRPA